MELNNYLKELESQIRNKKAKTMVIEEIRNHIKDQARFYKREGVSAKKAIEQAVKQMGDPVQVGIEMDRIHRPKPGGPLFLIAAIMSLCGLLTQYFSFYRLGDELTFYHQTMADNAFIRQCVYVLIGIIAMLVILCLDYSPVGRHGKKLGALLLAGLFIVCLFAPVYDGGKAYMKSLIYLFVPIYGGILYQNRNRGYYGIASGIIWPAAAFVIGVKQIGGGLGINFDMVCICYFMLTAAVFKGWFQESRKMGAVAGIIPAAAVLGTLTQLQPYQTQRLEVLFHPERYAEGAGYQMTKIREVIERLTLFGAGQGKPAQLPSRVLPGVQYDYILLQAASMYGIVTACLLIGLSAVFLFSLFRMVYKQKNQLGKAVGYGCIMVVGAETVQGLLNNFGFYTSSAGGLPFFSYGTCHTITDYALLGVIFSIYRYQNLTWENEKKIREREKGRLYSQLSPPHRTAATYPSRHSEIPPSSW